MDPEDGTVSLGGATVPEQRFTPLSDGEPLLRGCKLDSTAVREGSTLAFYSSQPPISAATARLRLFRLPEGIPVGNYHQPRQYRGFALSRDDRNLFAYQDYGGRLVLRATRPGDAPRCPLSSGHYPEGIRAELGAYWLAIGTEASKFVIRWDQGRFHVWQGPANGDSFYRIALGDSGLAVPGLPVTRGRLPEFLRYDTARFVSSAENRLIAVLDRFGQVALFEPDGRLLCMFFVLSRQGAAWMPDGTCFGSEKLLGEHPTPGAGPKIGRVLFDATQRSRGS